LGEDGPTHQPIEQLAALRAIPNMTVIRPADPTETAEAWRAAIRHEHGPVALVLTRQKVSVIDRAKFGSAAGLHRGAYVLADAPGGEPQVLLLATGSEVEIALSAYERLLMDGVAARVVSMPCLEYFAAQPRDYRDSVLPPSVLHRVAIEAAAPQPWYRWVGDRGAIIGIERFGASSPYQRIYKEFGLTVDRVVAEAKLLAQLSSD
jgi:transketolase